MLANESESESESELERRARDTEAGKQHWV
jgi:hypothetical protein